VSKKSIKSDLARLDRTKDADIDYSDIPPLGKEFLKKAAVPWPPPKQQLTILIPDSQRFAISRASSMGIKGQIDLCRAPPCQSYAKNLTTIHLRHEVLGQYLRALF
jgi:hypothetical protein